MHRCLPARSRFAPDKDDQAMQAAVGSAFIGVLHPYLLHSRESYVLPVYVGVGVRLIG